MKASPTLAEPRGGIARALASNALSAALPGSLTEPATALEFSASKTRPRASRLILHWIGKLPAIKN